jgi:hypothetical protein
MGIDQSKHLSNFEIYVNKRTRGCKMATGRSNFVWSNETNFVHVHGITVDKAIFEQILRPKL